MTDLNNLSETTVTWFSANGISIAIAVAVAIAVVFLQIGIKRLIIGAAKRLAAHAPWWTVLADVARTTRLWFMVALSARLVQGYAHAPQMVAQTLTFLFIVAATLQTALWARTFILGTIEQRAGNGENDANLASAMTIIRLLVSVAIFAIAAIIVLDNLGVDVTGLVAGLGVGGIAIGLAAQGIFSDLFAALSILFDKPFQVGETITYQGKEGPVTGTVEKIGLKSTRIRALTGEMRIIGNAQLLAQEVTNFVGRSYYRMQINLGVVYQTDPEVAAEIPDIMQRIVENHDHRFIRANFVMFGASSLDFELLFEAYVTDVVESKMAYQAIALGILREFNQRGIEFAYPTQTTFTAAPDGKMILPYAEPVRTA